jgi:hypothetical protein
MLFFGLPAVVFGSDGTFTEDGTFTRTAPSRGRHLHEDWMGYPGTADPAGPGHRAVTVNAPRTTAWWIGTFDTSCT